MAMSRDPLDGTGRRGNPIFESPEDMETKWNEYVSKCANNKVDEFTEVNKTKTVEGVTETYVDIIKKKVKKPLSPSIVGFCLNNRITRQGFYKGYANDDKYAEVFELMGMTSEVVTKELFEQGAIPTQLSGLWMSQFGNSTKKENRVKSEQSINIVEPSSHTLVKDMFPNEEKKDNIKT